MNPAKSIVDALGGAKVVAAYLGMSSGAVTKWGTPRERGGAGGLIPSIHIPALCEMSTKLAHPLEPNDFFPGFDVNTQW